MMNPGEDRILTIKKYSNRRFYDTTRSGHVTLGAKIHNFILAGELALDDYQTVE